MANHVQEVAVGGFVECESVDYTNAPTVVNPSPTDAIDTTLDVGQSIARTSKSHGGHGRAAYARNFAWFSQVRYGERV